MRAQPRLGRKPSLLISAVAAMLLAATAFAGLAIAHNGGGGHSDDPAGKIASFDSATGQLVIDLGDGGSISGMVTRWTWIDAGEDCGDEEDGDTSRQQIHGWGCRHRDLWGGHSGGHEGWWHHRDTSDLVEGAVVEDSLLVLKDGDAFYAKIDLEG